MEPLNSNILYFFSFSAKSDKTKKDSVISAKIKQAKADRKARGRGVSGSMCKKDKDIAYGNSVFAFQTAMSF